MNPFHLEFNPAAWHDVVKAKPILNKSLNLLLVSNRTKIGQLLALVSLNCAEMDQKGAKSN